VLKEPLLECGVSTPLCGRVDFESTLTFFTRRTSLLGGFTFPFEKRAVMFFLGRPQSGVETPHTKLVLR
jgi:hypothetical protein